MVSSIQRGRPTQRKKLQGAVIPRGDAIITYTPDRTFGAYCIAPFFAEIDLVAVAVIAPFFLVAAQYSSCPLSF